MSDPDPAVEVPGPRLRAFRRRILRLLLCAVLLVALGLNGVAFFHVWSMTMGVPSFPLAHLLTFWGGIQHGYWAFGHNPSRYAHSVRSPVLLMAGERDPRVKLPDATRIAENLAGEKRLVVFSGAGHLPMLKADAAIWRKEVADFLAARASRQSNPPHDR